MELLFPLVYHRRALSRQRAVASFYPRLSIHCGFLHFFEQTIRFRVGDAAGEIVFAVIPFHPATVEIGGQCCEGRVGRFESQEYIVMGPDRPWAVARRS